jgi:hypothetical protein
LTDLFHQKRDPDDLLLLYYSGHGITNRQNELFLTTTETNFDKPRSRGITGTETREKDEEPHTRSDLRIQPGTLRLLDGLDGA